MSVEPMEYIPGMPYMLALDSDTNEILALTFDDVDDFFVRENGEWVVPDDEMSDRLEESAFIQVEENAISIYDNTDEPTVEMFTEEPNND